MGLSFSSGEVLGAKAGDGLAARDMGFEAASVVTDNLGVETSAAGVTGVGTRGVAETTGGVSSRWTIIGVVYTRTIPSVLPIKLLEVARRTLWEESLRVCQDRP